MFPLFRLPVLAVNEVFKTMNVREIFLVSLLSNRADRAIRAAIPKGSVHFTFEVRGELVVRAENFVICTHTTGIRHHPELYGPEFEREDRNATLYKFGSKTFSVDPQGSFDHIIPEDVLDYTERRLTEDVSDLTRRHFEPDNAFKASMIQHFVKTFNPVVSLLSQDGLAVQLLRYLKRNNIEIRSFIAEFAPNAEELKEILTSCSDIDQLFICSYPPSGFQYSSPVEFTTRQVHLRGGWMKLEDFLNCEYLEIRGMDLLISDDYKSPEDLNAFFKKWMVTDCKLENFSIEGWITSFVNQDSFPIVVQGLSSRPMQAGPSIEVQKENGRIFKIQVVGNDLKMAPVEAN